MFTLIFIVALVGLLLSVLGLCDRTSQWSLLATGLTGDFPPKGFRPERPAWFNSTSLRPVLWLCTTIVIGLTYGLDSPLSHLVAIVAMLEMANAFMCARYFAAWHHRANALTKSQQGY